VGNSGTDTGHILVKSGGTFIVENTKGVGSATNSTITIESGATYIDKYAGVTPAFVSNPAHYQTTLIIKAGAVVKDKNGAVFIGPDSGNAAGTILQLHAGSELKGGYNGYVLTGNASLVKDFKLWGLAITNGSLTIKDGVTLLSIYNDPGVNIGADITLGAVYSTSISAQVILGGANSRIAVILSSVGTPGPNKSNTTKFSTGPAEIWTTTDDFDLPSLGISDEPAAYTTGHATFAWNGSIWEKK
jgi:hypothetical protein